MSSKSWKLIWKYVGVYLNESISKMKRSSPGDALFPVLPGSTKRLRRRQQAE
jgi:hypothetical protein